MLVVCRRRVSSLVGVHVASTTDGVVGSDSRGDCSEFPDPRNFQSFTYLQDIGDPHAYYDIAYQMSWVLDT